MTIETKAKINTEINKYMNARATLQNWVARDKMDFEDQEKAYKILLGRQRAIESLESKLEPIRFNF